MIKYRLSTLTGIGLTLAILPVLSCTRESGLRFAPESPRAGDEITVTYSPPATLSAEPELVLRGTYRTAADKPWLVVANERVLEIPVMKPGRGRNFTTRFTLPEGAVYAAFVVEDAAGEQLDTNGGRLFDLLVHAPDGRPLYHAYRRRADEFEDRNVHTSLEALQSALALYPDSLDGWSELRSLERSALGSTAGDSLFAWHEENFAALHESHSERADELSPSVIQGLASYAAAVRHSAGAAHWRAISERTVGTDEWALETGWQIMNRWETDGDAEATLAEFERYWPDARGTISPFGIFGLEFAIEVGNLEAVDRWAERFFPHRIRGFALSRMLAAIPERRERAVELARARYELPPPVRPLGRTAGEHARTLAVERAALTKDYARFLDEHAGPDEAMEIVEEATTRSASPDLFEILGELKLNAGDVAGAAQAYAVVASDPIMSPDQADSIATLVGHVPGSPEWLALLEAGEAQVLPHVLFAAVEWMPGDAHVTDAGGNRHAVADLIADKPTALIFWARWCRPCIAKIPAVVRLHEALERMGAQVISVAWLDSPGPEMDAFIEERGITYPVYHDLVSDATGVFDVFGVQTNFVLDADGKVRFERSELVDIPRQVQSLARQR